MNLYDKAYSSVVRHFAFPLHERAKGHSTFHMIREMDREQWIGTRELERLQRCRLRRLLEHAFRNVKYYQTIFDELHLTPDRFSTAADLVHLPLLSKDILRSRLEDLKSSELRRMEKFTTGGSTGSPVAFYVGPTRISSDVAARWRAESWWGVGIGDREYVIWGSPLELSKQDRARELRDRILRTRLLSAFEMNPDTMDRYLDEIERTGCTRIFGYPSSIFLLCQHARRQKRNLSKLGVQAVFVTAEYLWDHWRQTIRETLGCPVANGYGGRDSGFVAHECPQGGMHITADRIIVEIIDELGRPLSAGQTGEIVVTHLDTPEMPFIRYRTGDLGALSADSCRCGRSLPLIERIEGRKSDFIRTRDGRLLHGLALIYVLRKIPGIAQFRIRQKALDDFEVELVTNDAFREESEAEIRSEFERRLRTPAKVHVRYCPSLPSTRSGKFRYVISELDEYHLAPAPRSQGAVALEA